MIACHLNDRLDPDLRFAVRSGDVYVRPSFFSRKEEEPQSALIEDGRAHAPGLAERSQRSFIEGHKYSPNRLRQFWEGIFLFTVEGLLRCAARGYWASLTLRPVAAFTFGSCVRAAGVSISC